MRGDVGRPSVPIERHVEQEGRVARDDEAFAQLVDEGAVEGDEAGRRHDDERLVRGYRLSRRDGLWGDDEDERLRLRDGIAGEGRQRESESVVVVTCQVTRAQLRLHDRGKAEGLCLLALEPALEHRVRGDRPIQADLLIPLLLLECEDEVVRLRHLQCLLEGRLGEAARDKDAPAERGDARGRVDRERTARAERLARYLHREDLGRIEIVLRHGGQRERHRRAVTSQQVTVQPRLHCTHPPMLLQARRHDARQELRRRL